MSEPTAVYYCSIHRIDHRTAECPRCEAEERREQDQRRTQERHEEALAAQRETDYRLANPGEYQCPHCRYKTLLRNSSRCPKCHGIAHEGYWAAVEAQEAVEWRKEEARARVREAERVAAAKAAEEAAEDDERIKSIRGPCIFLLCLVDLAIVIVGFQHWEVPVKVVEPIILAVVAAPTRLLSEAWGPLGLLIGVVITAWLGVPGLVAVFLLQVWPIALATLVHVIGLALLPKRRK